MGRSARAEREREQREHTTEGEHGDGDVPQGVVWLSVGAIDARSRVLAARVEGDHLVVWSDIFSRVWWGVGRLVVVFGVGWGWDRDRAQAAAVRRWASSMSRVSPSASSGESLGLVECPLRIRSDWGVGVISGVGAAGGLRLTPVDGVGAGARWRWARGAAC